MHTLLTTLTFLFAAAAGWFALVAYGLAAQALKSARAAEGHEVRLKVLRTDVTALMAAVQALEHQLQRLQGRVYATPRRSPELELARDDIAAHLKASDDPRARRVGEVHASMGVGIAVPTAQRCKCGYCATCLDGPLGQVRDPDAVLNQS